MSIIELFDYHLGLGYMHSILSCFGMLEFEIGRESGSTKHNFPPFTTLSRGQVAGLAERRRILFWVLRMHHHAHLCQPTPVAHTPVNPSPCPGQPSSPVTPPRHRECDVQPRVAGAENSSISRRTQNMRPIRAALRIQAPISSIVTWETERPAPRIDAEESTPPPSSLDLWVVSLRLPLTLAYGWLETGNSTGCGRGPLSGRGSLANEAGLTWGVVWVCVLS